MQHVTVYGEPGIYAGWPANHGAWQRQFKVLDDDTPAIHLPWHDEFLVGFMRGKFAKHSMHNIEHPFEKLQARSLDGGESWKVEFPNADFMGEDARFPLNIYNPKTDILRFCGNYDTGGESCRREGAVYCSRDFGHEWEGPYTYAVFSDKRIQGTSRTCQLEDFVFVSTAWKKFWGTDYTACLRWNDGKFEYVSTVLNDEYRAVMPAAVRLPSGRVVVVLRRRGRRGSSARRGGWIDAVYSDDGCKTWSDPAHVGDTGSWNGNPPALIENDGVLYCAFGNRDDCAILLYYSHDGAEWRAAMCLRQGECRDIGYPRLFKRSDGKLVCVYYWSDKGEEQRIEATIF